MKAAAAAALLLAAGATAGAAPARRAPEPVLVPDVSSRRIDIVASFTGAELLLFGAILYPGGRTPARPPEVAIVVRGPPQPLLVRGKARVAGLWINRGHQRFAAVPSFYAVATPRPVTELLSPGQAARYQIGVANLALSPVGGRPEAQARYAAGLAALRADAGLFAEHVGAVSVRDGVLYRAAIPIPARVATGRYTAETYLIADGRVIAVATRGLAIRKTGLERRIATAADRAPLAYALAAVALSLALGWAAAALFRRRGR